MVNDRQLTIDQIKHKFINHILLTVHGICIPGDEICVMMRAQLQKRLDAAVLDELISTLRRTPTYRLSAHDVRV
jgi:hypothetical protein